MRNKKAPLYADARRWSTNGSGTRMDAQTAAPQLRVRAVRNDRPATLFVFLMFDVTDDNLRTELDVASNPVKAVARIKEGIRKPRKGGKKDACDWRLMQWIGPFNRSKPAHDFKKAWSRCSSDLKTRMRRGALLAQPLDLAVYTFRPRLLMRFMGEINSL
jgi:hypothetical protein